MSEERTTAVNQRYLARGPRPVRLRLLLIALLPTIVFLPMLLAFTVAWWNTKFDNLLISKVNGDLTIARQYLRRLLEHSGEKIRALGDSEAFATLVRSPARGAIDKHLDQRRSDLGLHFLYLVDANGEILSAAPAGPTHMDVMRWPVIVSALAWRDATAIDVLAADDLRRLSPELEQRARIELVPTRAAAPTGRRVETRGMLVHTATPIQLGDNRTGALVGGTLLNNNLVFIDTINDLVYTAGSIPDGSHGTATLFLDDVRVSTNVRLFENARALGTRVSSSVRDAVLGGGRIWLNRAFVVNDWYISAYEPILDSRGRRVGMLYVGFLEKPFQIAKRRTLITIIAAFLLIAAISVPIFLRWARSIFKPLEKMTETIALVESGDLHARTNLRHADDEIGMVASHLDELLNQIQERDRQLRDWATELNDRVELRTRELQSANEKLRATTQQLITSGKLAAIGEITACVAHEINNPIAIIQGNLDVLRQDLGALNDAAKSELALIDEQIHHINWIVTRLLQFAKPEEFAGYADGQDPADVLTDCLLLCRHLLGKGGIEVVRNDCSEGRVLINRSELQQVVLNLIVNAIHAMPEGGVLSLGTRTLVMNDVAGVAIDIDDTGQGIPPDIVDKIFDPFFTTKRGQGTGLGLSISQTIVRRWNGCISVKNRRRQGATFTIWLPEMRNGIGYQRSAGAPSC